MEEDEKLAIKVVIALALSMILVSAISDDTHYVKWTCGESNGIMAVSEDSEINCK